MYLICPVFHGIIRFGYFGLKYKYFHKGAEPMESFEPKKLALIRIWQILKEYSDCDHPLTQDDIARHLESDYGIVIERKAISRNISLLKEAGAEIESGRTGSYLERRDFEDSELKLLIDGVLCSKYITAKQTSVYKGYKRDKIEMRVDRVEVSDFPLYLNTVAGGLDRRDQTIGGFSFVVKIYAVPVVEIIGQLLYLLGRYGFNTQFGDCL